MGPMTKYDRNLRGGGGLVNCSQYGLIHLRVEIPFRVEIFSSESKFRLGISARKKQAENFSLFFGAEILSRKFQLGKGAEIPS